MNVYYTIITINCNPTLTKRGWRTTVSFWILIKQNNANNIA